MSSKIATVRQSIFTSLDTINGLRVSRYDIDDPPTPAAVVRFPRHIERNAFNGFWRYEVPILFLNTRSSDRTGDSQLEGFIDATFDLFDSDPDLGGNIESSQIMSVDGYKITKIGDTEYLACTMLVEVFA